MDPTRFVIGLGFLVLAVIAFKMDYVQWTFQIGSGQVKIYPGYGLLLIGGLIVLKEVLREIENLHLFRFRQ